MNCISKLVIGACLLTAVNVVAAPIRVLILSGQTVHDTASTTPFLEQMYNNSGKFKVIGIVSDMTKVTAETFAPCDVIVSNWTCHPTMTGGPWTAEGKKAFADAISRGKGMVSFHAASAACNDWPEFQQISGLTWIWDHTSHTSYHTFRVVINDTKHAITRGVPDFWITDELYQKMGKLSKSEFKTLASAFAEADFHGTKAWEPMLITTQLGKGRGVNLLLGHDVAAMRNPAWQTLMLRSTEWAATGKVSIPIPQDWPTTPAAAAVVGVDPDAAIKAATDYAHGQARGPLFTVEQLVNWSTARTAKTAAADRAALAGKLAAAIASCKTSEAKAFFCRELGMIGTPEQVPAIAPLLADEQAAMMARMALERIPGPAAASALRDALPQLKGSLRIGAIDSIGNRADADSVPAVAAFLADPDGATAIAAASALGKIGTAPAAEALKSARQSVPDALRPAITDACLACGERLLAAGDKKSAASICRLLYGPAEPPAVRAAALRGMVNAQPTQATPLIREALESPVRELHIAVADIIRTPKVGDTKAIAAAAMHMPADLLPIMIAALADRGEKAAADSIRRGMDHESEAVRVATIQALARLGDEADVAFLADRAAKGTDAERNAACDVLQRMPGQAAADAVMSLIKAGAVNNQAELSLLKANRPVNLARGAVADSPDDLGPDGAAGGDEAGIDGNPATYWDEVDSQPLYRYRVTFKQPTRVSAIVIMGHAFGSHCPKDFEILCDDKVVKTVKNAAYDQTGVEALFRFEPVTCSRVELKITGYDGKSPAIRELEIYDWPADGSAPSQPAASSQPAAKSSPAAYNWKQSDASLALMNGDRVVWRFNFAKDQPKACFDPVNLPDGTEMVWLSPPDHPWHFALWFSWKELNELNYWEQWNVPGQGRTEIVDARATASADYSAVVALTVSYHPDGKPPILTEKRTIHVWAPDAGGAYRIDWTGVFTAGSEDVHMKGGTAGGGYAGMSVRISPKTREWQLVDSEARRDTTSEGTAKNTHGQHSRWADFSFVSKLTEKPAGIAMFDHPGNLRYPSQWHNLINERAPFGYFSPAPLWSEPYTLAAGKELILRYRVLVHPGRPEAAQLEQEFRSFAAK